MSTPSVALFSYGTLQLPQVQLATYGRLLAGRSAFVYVGPPLDEAIADE